MRRLTKAAIATGGAAVLLLGGAGTVAYWTAQGTATGTEVTSGNLSVAAGTCAAWQYTAADGGGAVTLIVPGDTVETTCTLQVTGQGDHLGITATLDEATAFAESNDLVTALTPTLTTGSVEINGVAVPADPTQGVYIGSGGSHTVTVAVTAAFPYGDATASGNSTQDLDATLDNVVVNVVQTHTPPSP
ncbi:MAG: alternate-type signal peptide domain-containing protein [Cellulomonas sp.]|jgi:alternate signal-mediated exported protein|nr:alternate-type signal peptide domain-containing protein [Cellulomonas sp.]